MAKKKKRVKTLHNGKKSNKTQPKKKDREIWETFKTVLFPAMKKENQIFYMNVMKNI